MPRFAICHFPESKNSALSVLYPYRVRNAQRFSFQAPQLPTPRDKKTAEDEDGKNEEADEPEDADPPNRNFFSAYGKAMPHAGPCYRLSGAVSSSVTLSDGTNSAEQRSARQNDRLTKEARATLGLQMIEDLPIGRFRAGFEMDWIATSGSTSAALNTMWLSLGPYVLGLKGSNFDFWAGDEFGFKATAPAANTFLASLAFRTSESSALTLSAEDPTIRRLSDTGYGGLAMPDLVARWKYETESTTLHIGAAAHQLRFASPARATRYGYAGIIGWQQQVSTWGEDDYFTLQGVYADTAPGYLGIAQPGGLLRFTLPRSGPVLVLETMRGWTVALAYSHGWSTTWRSNAFVTYLDLRVPEAPGRGKIQFGRAAINLVWTPISGLDLTWEIGVARHYRLSSFFGIANYPKSPSFTAQWTVSRKF